MTLSYEKAKQNEENNAANARVLAETLRIMRQSLTIRVCAWCGVREIESPNAQDACPFCEDMLVNCF